MARKQENQAGVPELQERVVYINRVSKVVKGGRRFALTALVVVGDGKGRVGIGMGKSQEVPTAIKKGVEDAKKNMFSVAITKEGTVPHDIVGEFAKSLGTDNVLNIVKAVAEGLKEMQSPEAVSARRGVSVAKIYGWKEN